MEAEALVEKTVDHRWVKGALGEVARRPDGRGRSAWAAKSRPARPCSPTISLLISKRTCDQRKTEYLKQLKFFFRVFCVSFSWILGFKLSVFLSFPPIYYQQTTMQIDNIRIMYFSYPEKCFISFQGVFYAITSVWNPSGVESHASVRSQIRIPSTASIHGENRRCRQPTPRKQGVFS